MLTSIPRPSKTPRREPTQDEINEIVEASYSTAYPSSAEPTGPVNDPFPFGFGFDDGAHYPSAQAITSGIDLYFQYCHRQPVWCFDRDELEENGCLSKELIFSIMALTFRFSRERGQTHNYGDNARNLIMLRIANGSVELETIESLCLLSYSSFIGMVFLSLG